MPKKVQLRDENGVELFNRTLRSTIVDEDEGYHGKYHTIFPDGDIDDVGKSLVLIETENGFAYNHQALGKVNSIVIDGYELPMKDHVVEIKLNKDHLCINSEEELDVAFGGSDPIMKKSALDPIYKNIDEVVKKLDSEAASVADKVNVERDRALSAEDQLRRDFLMEVEQRKGGDAGLEAMLRNEIITRQQEVKDLNDNKQNNLKILPDSGIIYNPTSGLLAVKIDNKSITINPNHELEAQVPLQPGKALGQRFSGGMWEMDVRVDTDIHDHDKGTIAIDESAGHNCLFVKDVEVTNWSQVDPMGSRVYLSQIFPKTEIYINPDDPDDHNLLVDEKTLEEWTEKVSAKFMGNFESEDVDSGHVGDKNIQVKGYPVGSDIPANAFIYISTTEGGNSKLYRYKAISNHNDVTDKWELVTWEKEYEINTSPFSRSQWETINSGLTSGNVAEINNFFVKYHDLQSILGDDLFNIIRKLYNNRADMAENNQSKLGYIANRTHYTGTDGVHLLSYKYSPGAYVTTTGVANNGGIMAATSGEVFNDYTNNTAAGNYAHAEGTSTAASGAGSHAEGSSTLASGASSHTEGTGTTASGLGSHAEGSGTTASANFAHAEGESSTSSGIGSHAEGNSQATGKYSHAEGTSQAANLCSHAEGNNTKANGESSHTEGSSSKADGKYSHAEGESTQAQGEASHVEGKDSKSLTIAKYSHAEGEGTIASSQAQHVEGSYNIDDSQYIHITGIGTDDDNRKNGFTVSRDGDGWFFRNIVANSGNITTLNGDIVANIGGEQFSLSQHNHGLPQLSDSDAGKVVLAKDKDGFKLGPKIPTPNKSTDKNKVVMIDNNGDYVYNELNEHIKFYRTGTIPAAMSVANNYTQIQVSVPGITADDHPCVDVICGGVDAKQDEALIDNWRLVYKAVSGNGFVTFYVNGKLGKDIPVSIKW